jgi:trans-aconitate methyltransferase
MKHIDSGHYKRFTDENLYELHRWLAEQLAALFAGDSVAFEVPNPDLGAAQSLYSGQRVSLDDGRVVVYRGMKTWVDLAELLGCRLLTPEVLDSQAPYVRLRMQKLDTSDAFHDVQAAEGLPANEKYGVQSRFSRIDKLEEPSYVLTLRAAIERVDLQSGARVLDLGVNDGQELALFRSVYGEARFEQLSFVGVDHSASALARAAERFASHCQFIQHDINEIAKLALGRFDLLFSIATLHSPGIRESKKLFMQLIQEHLTPSGAVILGFPNCRWAGGEVSYGAQSKNHNFRELSLLFKDVDFCKRYLQQHRFRVTLTGKYYVVLTATKLRALAPSAVSTML